MLGVNAVLYGWNLGINGWANYFYSAAVQAGTMDITAFFFGSSDWGNSITVDKPPLSLWIMGVSVRFFGFNPIAVLLPQVAMGVTTTLLIYLILRRQVSSAAALFGAIVFFTTPIITLMSRYNNPDPLMLLLMTAAAWFVLLSVETHLGRYFILAGALLGLAFMTKQMQGLLSVPALGLAYILFSAQSWPKRVGTVLSATTALLITGGLWMTIVDSIPAAQRPFVGGSPSNSVWQLTLEYNGVERIAGGENTPPGMQIPTQFRPTESDAGLFRLLNPNFNQEATWFLFAGILALVMLGIQWNKNRDTTALRALTLIAGIWLLTAYFLLSLMSNEIHTYYTASLGPPLALVLGLTFEKIVRNPNSVGVRLWGSLVSFTALLTSWLILGGTEEWPSWLPTCVLALGTASLSGLCVKPPNPRVRIYAATGLVVAILVGPVVTSIHNVTVASNGSNPLSGPASKNSSAISHLMSDLRDGALPWAHDVAYGRVPDKEVVSALSNAKGCTWAAATYPSQTAARLQLESSRPILPIGGFAGIDPSPTLGEFQSKVAAGEICYFVEQEAFVGVQAPGSTSVEISTWVKINFHSEDVGDSTVYRLDTR